MAIGIPVGGSAGRSSANDSSSETAEGGSGLAQPVPTGGAQEKRTESADAPDVEAQAATDRSRPERFSAAPLLAVTSIRKGHCKEPEKTNKVVGSDIVNLSDRGH